MPSEGETTVLSGAGDDAVCFGGMSGGNDHGLSPPVAEGGAAKSFASTLGAAAGSGGGCCGGD